MMHLNPYSSLNNYRHNQINMLKVSTITEQLSSGQRIPRANLDPASSSISVNMRAQLRGLEQASRNVQDGLSLVQTAEQAVSDVQSSLQRMRELAVQASNETLTLSDRQSLQTEINSLIEGIEKVATNTTFNNHKLFSIELENEVVQVPVKPGQVVLAASFKVPEGEKDTLIVHGFFDNISGVEFPDINVLSPTGELFGWWPGSYNGQSKMNDYLTTNDGKSMVDDNNNSSNRAEYSGWAGNPESMRFENPVSGTWRLYAQSIGGQEDSNYNVGYDYFSTPKQYNIQTGANSGDVYTVEMSNITPVFLGINNTSVLNAKDSQTALENIDKAIDYTLSEIGKYGAYSTHLEHTSNSLSTYTAELTGVESRISDLDYAKGIMDLTKYKLLQQVQPQLSKNHDLQPTQVLQLLQA
ncbi:flagellin [Bacillus pinisoli]|uniref:flagellin N-terminal helical domain-containing protein n=1 Tax=Bacillus pinisoli TaxID=2901866 RepID=UPI001FF4C021|nr:flagellin [Bacillus pinisoli]